MLSAMPASLNAHDEPVVLQTRRQRDYLIIDLPSDRMVQLTDISQLCHALDQAVDEYEAVQPRVLLSFRGVQYISSTFLGRLMGLNKRLAQRSGRLMVADMEPAVRDAFCLTQMQKQIPLYRTTAEAIANRSWAWLAMLAITCCNALLGLRGLMTLLSAGWTPQALSMNDVALACFIAYIPLPAAILLTRGRFCRLDHAFQWSLVTIFLFITICALPAYLTAAPL